MRTAWGYDVEYLEPLLSLEQFTALTNGAYDDAERVESALLAASQAIRNYCGWHISPSLECCAYPVSRGKLIKLAAGYVSEILSVEEDGAELTEGQFEWRSDGLLRRCCFRNWSSRWNAVKVVYRAGYDVLSVPDLAEAVRSITTSVLAVTAGVTQESADGVSISYSQNAASVAAALTASQKSALAAYKVVSNHGA